MFFAFNLRLCSGIFFFLWQLNLFSEWIVGSVETRAETEYLFTNIDPKKFWTNTVPRAGILKFRYSKAMWLGSQHIHSRFFQRIWYPFRIITRNKISKKSHHNIHENVMHIVLEYFYIQSTYFSCCWFKVPKPKAL